MALGRDYHGVFSLKEADSYGLCQLARSQQEQCWPLPLAPWHLPMLSSSFAEMGNVAGAEGTPGATTAAAFLSRFVGSGVTQWLHLDLSASYQKNANDLWAPGGKGHGVRTIAAWLQQVVKS